MKDPKILQASETEIVQMVAAYPFGQLISQKAGDISATPLPWLLKRGAGGSAAIIGHFARANSQVEQLREDGCALIVFQGPHEYSSPSLLNGRNQAPTRKYAMVQFSARVKYIDTEKATRSVVERLNACLETGNPNAWHTYEMGHWYQTSCPQSLLLKRVLWTLRASSSWVRTIAQPNCMHLFQDWKPSIRLLWHASCGAPTPNSSTQIAQTRNERSLLSGVHQHVWDLQGCIEFIFDDNDSRLHAGESAHCFSEHQQAARAFSRGREYGLLTN